MRRNVMIVGEAESKSFGTTSDDCGFNFSFCAFIPNEISSMMRRSVLSAFERRAFARSPDDSLAVTTNVSDVSQRGSIALLKYWGIDA